LRWSGDLGLVFFNGASDAPRTVMVCVLKGSCRDIESQRDGYLPDPVVAVLGVNRIVLLVNQDSFPHTTHSDIPGFDSRIVERGEYWDLAGDGLSLDH